MSDHDAGITAEERSAETRNIQASARDIISCFAKVGCCCCLLLVGLLLPPFVEVSCSGWLLLSLPAMHWHLLVFCLMPDTPDCAFSFCLPVCLCSLIVRATVYLPNSHNCFQHFALLRKIKIASQVRHTHFSAIISGVRDIASFIACVKQATGVDPNCQFHLLHYIHNMKHAFPMDRFALVLFILEGRSVCIYSTLVLSSIYCVICAPFFVTRQVSASCLVHADSICRIMSPG